MNKANRSFKIMLAYYDNSLRATIFSSLLLSQYITGFAETTKIVLKKNHKVQHQSSKQPAGKLSAFHPAHSHCLSTAPAKSIQF